LPPGGRLNQARSVKKANSLSSICHALLIGTGSRTTLLVPLAASSDQTTHSNNHD
jgi:hypothetical protein